MYCSPACQRAHEKELRDKKSGEGSKKKKNIAPVSDKKLEELAMYRPIRDEYLSAHKECEVDDCNRRSTNLHHKMGRSGYADEESRFKGIKLLWDVRYFMACCHICHPFRIHHEANDGWARKNGYIL